MHGHNYKVEVFVDGQKNQSGMLMDFNHIKAIIESYDHITLNDRIDQPTVENMVTQMLDDFSKLEDTDNVSSIRVRIWEDTESYAEDTWVRSA